MCVGHAFGDPARIAQLVMEYQQGSAAASLDKGQLGPCHADRFLAGIRHFISPLSSRHHLLSIVSQVQSPSTSPNQIISQDSMTTVNRTQN